MFRAHRKQVFKKIIQIRMCENCVERVAGRIQKGKPKGKVPIMSYKIFSV